MYVLMCDRCAALVEGLYAEVVLWRAVATRCADGMPGSTITNAGSDQNMSY